MGPTRTAGARAAWRMALAAGSGLTGVEQEDASASMSATMAQMPARTMPRTAAGRNELTPVHKDWDIPFRYPIPGGNLTPNLPKLHPLSDVLCKR